MERCNLHSGDGDDRDSDDGLSSSSEGSSNCSSDSDSDSDFGGHIKSGEKDFEGRLFNRMNGLNSVGSSNKYKLSASGQNGELYGKYLFKELCVRVIMIYQDLIKKLASNAFISAKSAVKPSQSNVMGSCQCPRSLGQAIEECEFLKGAFRQVLPSESVLQPSTYTGVVTHPPIAAIRAFAGKEYPSTEQLAVSGRIYTMMVAR